MTAVMIANSSKFEVGRRVAVLSIAISAVLAGANLTVGYIAGSTSVVATGFEFGGDVLASGLVLVGMTLASKPADKEHPYGHGRIELLSGLAVGLILAAGGIGIAFARFRECRKFTPRHGSILHIHWCSPYWCAV